MSAIYAAWSPTGIAARCFLQLITEYLESEDEELTTKKMALLGYSDGHSSELVKLANPLWENHTLLPVSLFLQPMISAMNRSKIPESLESAPMKITLFMLDIRR